MTNITDLIAAATGITTAALAAAAITTIATRPLRERRRWARIIRNAAP